MLKKIKNSLGAKTFIFIFLLLSLSIAFVYGLVMIFMPGTYQFQINQAVEIKFEKLVTQLNDKGFDEEAIETFAKENSVMVSMTGQNGEMIASWGEDAQTDADDSQEEQEVVKAAMGSSVHEVKRDGESYLLSTSVQPVQVNYATDALIKLIPYVILAILFLSGLGSYLVYHFISKPVIKLSLASEKLAKLEFDGDFQIKQNDELGVLAQNMNYLAKNLSLTLEELQGTNEQLKEEVEHEIKRKLQQRDFFSAVSHELKTPITLIKCVLDGMINNIGTYKDRDQYLAYTQNVVTEMEELVKEIITVSKLDSMDELMEMSSINLSSLVNSYVLRNEKLAESKQIRITSLIEENIFIVADQNLMRKVVSNIINNAIFHSPAAALIEVNLKQKNSGEAQLIITNSGVTIPEDLLPEIFEPFKRVERSRNRSSGGSGLGLYIVQSILTKHNYAFKLKNEGNKVKFEIQFSTVKELDTEELA